MIELACISPASLQVFTSFLAVYIDVLEVLLVPVSLPSLAQGRFQLHSFAGTTRPFVCYSPSFPRNQARVLSAKLCSQTRSAYIEPFTNRFSGSEEKLRPETGSAISGRTQVPSPILRQTLIQHQPEPHLAPGLTSVLEGRPAIFGSCSMQPWPQ
jgi:hypothetical protein